MVNEVAEVAAVVVPAVLLFECLQRLGRTDEVLLLSVRRLSCAALLGRLLEILHVQSGGTTSGSALTLSRLPSTMQALRAFSNTTNAPVGLLC